MVCVEAGERVRVQDRRVRAGFRRAFTSAKKINDRKNAAIDNDRYLFARKAHTKSQTRSGGHMGV